MKKIRKINEFAWILGIVLCALGVSLCTKAGFGLSMVAAPAYIIHVKMVSLLPWFSQGTSEYVFQAIILAVLCIAIRNFKPKFLLSFVTAFISGLVIDGWLYLLGGNIVYNDMTIRIIAFISGEIITTLAVAFFFRTRLPLQVYELFVKEIAKRYKFSVARVKYCYDIGALVLSVVLAFLLNRSFCGIGVGTIIITIINAPLIKIFGKILDRVFDFSPMLPNFVSLIGEE